MNATLLNFETAMGLGPTFAARLLGVAYTTYAQYRAGRRALPRYHQLHIQALLLLPEPARQVLIEEHANGKRKGRAAADA